MIISLNDWISLVQSLYRNMTKLSSHSFRIWGSKRNTFFALLKYIVFHPSQYSSENSNYLDENETVITINVSGIKGINMMRIAQNQ